MYIVDEEQGEWYGLDTICDDSSIILPESTLLITIGFKRNKIPERRSWHEYNLAIYLIHNKTPEVSGQSEISNKPLVCSF